MKKEAPRRKQTLSSIAFDLGFTTRHGKHERADYNYLVFSLMPFKVTLKREHKFDLDNLEKRKVVPFTVIKFIYSKLG